MATAPSPAPAPGPGRESGTETVKRPSAEQDVNFAAKRDAQGSELDRDGEAKRLVGLGWTKMNVVGWLVIDAGDKEVAAELNPERDDAGMIVQSTIVKIE